MTIDLSLPRLGWRRDAEAATVAPETDLARSLADGDSGALAAVYDQYATPLYRMMHGILGSAEDAEDALQEVFARLATGRIGHVCNLRAYLYTSARNEAYGMLRRRRREPIAELSHDETGLPVTTAPDGNEDLLALLQRLPAEQREVIALKVFEELTFAEIAVIVKASPNTVASRYRYGIERLRTWSRAEEDAL